MPQQYLRASEVYGVSVRDVGYAWIWSPPSPPVADEVVPEVVPEVVERVNGPMGHMTPETITDIDGGLHLLGKWLIRFWLRISVRRTS
jgi:hypothetical protein